MKRPVAIACVATLAVVLFAPSASARNDKKHFPIDTQPFDFQSCDGTEFHVDPVAVNEFGKIVSELPDGTTVIHITGRLVVDLTANGVTVRLKISGPGTLTFYANGDFLLDGQGRSLQFLPPDAAARYGLPQLFISTGEFVVFFGAGGDIQLLKSTGRIVDLCQVFA